MAEYICGMSPATIAGSSTLPILSIAGSSTVSGILTAFWMYNTTSTACSYRLVRFTAGTAGAGQTEVKKRLTAPTSICQVSAGHTAGVTVSEDLGYRLDLPAAIGAGGFITLGAGVETPTAGTTPGIGLIAVGTGQVCNVGFEWYE